MSPPKRKAPRLAEHQTEGDQNQLSKETIPLSAVRVNGKPAPHGYGWEAGKLVPVEMPPVEAVPMSREQVLLRAIAHACSWSNGEPVRWQSFLSVAGFDSRPLSEIAESLRVSPRLVQLRVAECREWLVELRAEMEGEARP
jgi:hypothetical protein